MNTDKGRKKWVVLGLLAAIVAALVALSSPASATGTDHPDCDGRVEIQVNAPSFTVPEGTWDSVWTKAANTDHVNQGALEEGTVVTSGIYNDNGQEQEISHVDLCPGEEPPPPCEWDENLPATDPGCQPPPEPCEYNAELPADHDDCRPQQPDDKVEYGEWVDKHPFECGDETVKQKRTVTTTTYVWDGDSWELDTVNAVVTYEFQHRQPTEEELASCRPHKEVIPVPATPGVEDPCGPDNATWVVPSNTESVTWTLNDDGSLRATANEGFIFEGHKYHVDFGKPTDSGEACPPAPPPAVTPPPAAPPTQAVVHRPVLTPTPTTGQLAFTGSSSSSTLAMLALVLIIVGGAFVLSTRWLRRKATAR